MKRGISVREWVTGLARDGAALARQMDWARGLRAGAALCVPLAAVDVTGFAPLGWAALGGFEAIISDAGGPYRIRLTRLSLLSLGGALGLTVGSLVGGNLWLALPVTGIFCFLWSYLGVLGPAFAGSGLLVQVIYICGLGAPEADWKAAGLRGGMLLAGGVWAMVISLVLWPFDPYRPARNAVGDCYEALASFQKGIRELAERERVRPALWHRLAKHHQRRLRASLETAWESVASVRAETRAESVQSSFMVVLLEAADMLLGRSVALAEHMEALGGSAGMAGGEGAAGLNELLEAEEWVAGVLRKRVEVTRTEAGERRRRLAELPQRLGETGWDELLRGQVAEGLLLMETAVEAAAALRLGEGKTAVLAAKGSHVRERMARLREGWRPENLRSHFRKDSLLLRHAVRVALVCMVDVGIVHTLRLDHGYWLLMTSLIVLQPYVSGTMRRGLERTVGTVAGGVFAAVLAIVLHTKLLTAVVLFPLSVLCLTFLPINYAVFAFFLTPVFVLAYLPYPGDWQLALVRVGDTAVGALVALGAMRVLFPSYERERAGSYLVASLEANRRYVEALLESWATGEPRTRQLAQARRATGLAHNAVEESLDRMMAERWSRKGQGAEAALAVATYLRRFAQSVTAMTTLNGAAEWKASAGVQGRLGAVAGAIGGVERQLRCGGPAGAASGDGVVGEVAAEGEEAALGVRLVARLERQAAVLERQVEQLRQQQGIRCA